MTKDDFSANNTSIVIAGSVLPIFGIMLLLMGFTFFSTFLIVGGPVIAFVFYMASKGREQSIQWIKISCPYCAEEFEVEPVNGPIKHLKCKQQLAIKDGKAYRLGEVPTS